MQISKEKLLHIAELAKLKIREEEIPVYMKNLEDILNYVRVINSANVEDEDENVNSVTLNYNVFRKDEVNKFEDTQALLQNAPEKETNMFKIPKVI